MDRIRRVVARVFGDKKNNEKSEDVDVTLATLEGTDITTSQSPYICIVQNFLLVWLDETIDEINNQDCCNTITKLREEVNTVNTFTDIDECIDFVTEIREEKVFIISSGAFGQTMAAVVHDMSHVSSVYIFCEKQTLHEQWKESWPKVKGVFTDIASICELLKQTVKDCDRNSVSLSFVAAGDGSTTQNLNQLDQSFMYTQILKEILLTIDFEQEHIMEFIIYCREQLIGNTAGLHNIDKLEGEYRAHTPIWWYSCPSVLFSMLNRALRMMEVDLIIKMGFFVQDLHKQISQLYWKQYASQLHSGSFIVYRGQGLSKTNFEQLKKTQSGLMSFNNFLSTSLDRSVSLAFADSNSDNPDLVGVLFQITINLSISSTPFANIRDVSYYQGEEEILFSMHSIFRIGYIKQINNNHRLWQVDLTLTNDSDPQLQTLTEYMREETLPGQKGWYRLGNLLIKLGQFGKAQQVFDIMLHQKTNAREKGNIHHVLGLIKENQGKHTEAIASYQRSLKINRRILSSPHPDLSSSYNNIGAVYYKMGDYSQALSFYKIALEIRRKTLPVNLPLLATSYNNIGLVYCKVDNYPKALLYYEKALELKQRTLPANHPMLATSYNNIGSLCNKMGFYSRALSSHEKALEIKKKALPSNHPGLASSYGHIGMVSSQLREHSKAVLYCEQALKIIEYSLPANHSDLQLYRNNLEYVKKNCE